MNRAALMRLEDLCGDLVGAGAGPVIVEIVTTNGQAFKASGAVWDILEVTPDFVRLSEEEGRWWLIDPRTIGSVEITSLRVSDEPT